MSKFLNVRFFLACMLVFISAGATSAFAQVPPRFYWKTMSGTNAVPVIYQSVGGNANPMDPAYLVSPSTEFEADVAIAGYARILTLFDRSAMIAALLPTGRLTSRTTVGALTSTESASGFGDPLLEFNINIFGPDPIKNIPDMLRYEPGLSVDVIVDLTVPIGEYNNDQLANLGQNRWYGRVGFPTIWQIGAWVPGRRTTLELIPSLWLYGDNDDYLSGSTLQTDPMFELETHLTRDFTESFWGSLDAVWVSGGKSSVDGVEGDSTNNIGLGYTLGYHVTENLQFTFGYMATVNDSDPGDLQLDGFRVSFVYGWHKIIEGMNRLEN